MGMESYYINLKVGKSEKELIKSEIETKATYKNGLSFGDFENYDEISVIGSTFSFLPSCCLMYKLCCDVARQKAGFVFETYGEERVFDFESKAQFISFMYSKWETLLDGLAERMGMFLIHPSNAYKALRKLKKKYYAKF